MKKASRLKLRSVCISSGLVIGFLMVQGPLWRPSSEARNNLTVMQPVETSGAVRRLNLAAGKSLIVGSASQIVAAAVANPDLAGTTAINPHELLVNGKAPGVTTLTVWQKDGEQRAFELRVRSAAPDRAAVTGPSAEETAFVASNQPHHFPRGR